MFSDVSVFFTYFGLGLYVWKNCQNQQAQAIIHHHRKYSHNIHTYRAHVQYRYIGKGKTHHRIYRQETTNQNQPPEETTSHNEQKPIRRSHRLQSRKHTAMTTTTKRNLIYQNNFTSDGDSKHRVESQNIIYTENSINRTCVYIRDTYIHTYTHIRTHVHTYTRTHT